MVLKWDENSNVSGSSLRGYSGIGASITRHKNQNVNHINCNLEKQIPQTTFADLDLLQFRADWMLEIPLCGSEKWLSTSNKTNRIVRKRQF